MKELEIIIDQGGIEKKVIISSGIISFDNNNKSICSKYDITTIVIAGNGEFPPPFLKGSKVLRDIRKSNVESFNNWKLIFPLQLNSHDFFRFSVDISLLIKEDQKKDYWGMWHCESESEEFPDILLINFPLWTFSRRFKKGDFGEAEFTELLSYTYRMIFSAVSAVSSFYSLNKKRLKPGILALSDIGNNLIDKSLISNISENDFLSNDIYKLRIRVFTQVLSEWLSKNDYYNKAVISYGEGIRVDLIERAWDVQAEESKSDIAEFGEAIILRSKSLAYINDLLHSTKRISFKDALKRAMETFSVSPPSLVADLIQSRALSEAISYEFCEKHGLGAQSSNLFSYIQRIEESKTVSPWVTSYLHVIRQLGNEAAHYKSEILRRPEKPVGKDLIVIHAALNRILAFCIDEKL
jgi:hypothetical protein